MMSRSSIETFDPFGTMAKEKQETSLRDPNEEVVSIP